MLGVKQNRSDFSCEYPLFVWLTPCYMGASFVIQFNILWNISPIQSPNMPNLLIIFLFLPIFVEADASTKGRPSYYWTNRWLECINHGISISRCSLFEEGRISELNPGCFDELDESTNQTRVYCRLNCEESDEATVLRKEPPNNHICSAYHTYNLERRRRDWYIWRSGECISTTIKFVLRCGFPSDPRVFYAQNRHLFDYEDNKNVEENNTNG